MQYNGPFIKLTFRCDDTPLYVRPELIGAITIESVNAKEGKFVTAVHVSAGEGQTFFVKETPEEVIQMIRTFDDIWDR